MSDLKPGDLVTYGPGSWISGGVGYPDVRIDAPINSIGLVVAAINGTCFIVWDKHDPFTTRIDRSCMLTVHNNNDVTLWNDGISPLVLP